MGSEKTITNAGSEHPLLVRAIKNNESFKICIDEGTCSKEQKFLLENGCCWADGRRESVYFDRTMKPYILFVDDGYISWSYNTRYFDAKEYDFENKKFVDGCEHDWRIKRETECGKFHNKFYTCKKCKESKDEMIEKPKLTPEMLRVIRMAVENYEMILLSNEKLYNRLAHEAFNEEIEEIRKTLEVVKILEVE